MKPVRPATARHGAQFVEIAKDQPEYETLPAFVSPDGTVQTEWELSDEDRAKIAAGGRVRLFVLTFGAPLQPLLVEVT